MFLHKNQLKRMDEIKREFLFDNESASMHPLLKEIIAFLKIHLPSETYAEKISNCKQILIELLTNAVKHSGTTTTTVSVVIAANKVQISKSDSGRKFYLSDYTGMPPIHWPFKKEYVGGKLKIYEDDISHLYAIIHSENRIVFELLEYPIEDITSSTVLLEHYGLLILTKLSNEFYYLYDPNSHSNQFCTVLSLHD